MATKITRWSPDTCQCVLEYTWDSDTPAETRTHTFHRVVRSCPAHVTLQGANKYNEVKNENQNKNRGVGVVASTLGVDSREVAWNINQNREIELEPQKGLTAQERVDVNAALAAVSPKLKLKDSV